MEPAIAGTRQKESEWWKEFGLLKQGAAPNRSWSSGVDGQIVVESAWDAGLKRNC